MKKLFKQLSIVLVLAMVIGLVPARQASAADYSVKLKHKYLFVGGAKGVDANGNLPANPIKKSYKVKINGLEKGDVVTLKSSDKTVAKAANNKYPQRVFAVAPGAAEFTVKVNGAEVGTLKVTVKQNATALEIVDLPENNQFGIGTYEVKVATTPAAATDVVKLVIADEYKDIAVVNEDGTITTKKPGTFKMSAVACQNAETLPGATAKAEEVECTAAVKVVSLAQKSSTELKLTFDTEMKDIAKAGDFRVFTKTAGSEFTQNIKSVAVDADDATVVVLTLWNKLVEETEYFVDYSKQVNSIKAAKLGIAQAAKIRFNETEIVKGIYTDIDFSVLDANDVEIDGLEAYVSFETPSNPKVSCFDRVIKFDEAGLTASVTAKFAAPYTDEKGAVVENKFSNVALFKSVEVAPVTITAYEWSLDNNADFDDDDYVANKFIATNDAATKFNLKLTFSDGSELVKYGTSVTAKASKDGKNFAADVKTAGFTLDTADKTIALVDGQTIKPVKAGATQLLVYVGTEKEPKLVLPLDVKAKAVPTTITLEAQNGKSKINTNASFNDSVTFDVVVKDQHGRLIASTVTVEEASSSANISLKKTPAIAVTGDDGEYEFTVAKSNIQKDGSVATGTIMLKVTATVGSAKVENATAGISCLQSDNVAKAYKLVFDTTVLDQIGGDAAYDVTGARAFKPYDTSVKYYAVDASGYAVTEATEVDTFDEDTDGVYFRVYNGSKELTYDADLTHQYVDDHYISSKCVASGDSVATKLEANALTVKLVNYKAKTSSAAAKEDVLDIAVLTIKDSQPAVNVYVNPAKTDDQYVADSTFMYDYNGTVGTAFDGTVTLKDNSTNVYVYSVTFVDTDSNSSDAIDDVAIVVPVNKLFTK